MQDGELSLTYGEELEVEPVLPITKLELEDSVGADLRDGREPPGFEKLAKPRDEDRGGSGSCAGKFGEVAAKTGIYK